MGGRKKGFIDKKRSATFTLVARDSASSSSSNPLSTDRVFVRTDNHHDYSVPGFLESDEEQYNKDDESSIFADAVEDADVGVGARYAERGSGSALSEEVRREILELGLPDDGYNYLSHLREIRNEGGGSAYYENPRVRFDLVPLDVKVCTIFCFLILGRVFFGSKGNKNLYISFLLINLFHVCRHMMLPGLE